MLTQPSSGWQTLNLSPKPAGTSRRRSTRRDIEMDSFDPYYTWLGIRPEEQPADFYRLLGLQRFEENRDVISHAADQRLGHIRSFQNGPHALESQRVLNDLSKAAGCLLNPRRKAMYDQHLRSSELKQMQAEALRPPSAGVEPGISIQIDPAKSSRRPPPRQAERASRKWLWIGSIAVGAVLAAVVYLVQLRVGSPSPVIPDANLVSSSASSPQPHESHPAATNSRANQNTKAGSEQASSTGNAETASDPLPADRMAAQPAPVDPASVQLSPSAQTPAPAVSNDAAALASSSASAVDRGLPPVMPGKPKALSFDLVDRIEITNSQGLVDLRQPFTVEMWVRFSPGEKAHWLCGDLIIGPNHPEVATGSIAGWQFFIQQTVNARHRVAFSTQDGYASDFPVVEKAWHHLAACNDGKQVTVFVDGRRSATGAVDRLLQSFVPSPIPVHFGGHGYLHASQPAGFSGDLRGFRISSTSRYSANFTPAEAFEKDDATEVLFDFVAAEGANLPDLSGHKREGKIVGAQWFGLDESALAARVPAPTPSAPPASAPSVTSRPLPGTESSVDARPTPAEAELAKAREQLQQVFGDELARAKEPRELLELTDRLLALAADSRDDVASRYVMLDKAQQLSAQSGNLEKAFSVIDDFARSFQIQTLELKSAAAKTASDMAKSAADRRRVAEAAVTLGEECLIAGRFELASDAVQIAVTQAGRAREIDLSKLARDFRDEITQVKRASVEAEEASEGLKTDPSNPELNLRWGRFLAFRQRNFDRGLPHLAKGSDEALAALAQRDLAKPTDGEQQAELGRAWREAADRVENLEKPAVLLRALEWSRKAHQQLNGLAKAEVDKRMREIESELPARFQASLANAPGNSSAPVIPQPPREFIGLLGRIQSNGVDVGVLWRYEAGLRLSNQSISDVLMQANVVRGKLRVEFIGLLNVPESMTVNVAHSGGSPTGSLSLLIDNKPVGEVGGMRATSDVYKLELNAGEHQVRWVLSGDDLGNSSLTFTHAASGQRLPVYHNPQLLTFVRETPSRARLNVNMLKNP